MALVIAGMNSGRKIKPTFNSNITCNITQCSSNNNILPKCNLNQSHNMKCRNKHRAILQGQFQWKRKKNQSFRKKLKIREL